jgi:hypothetical protein
MRSWNSSERGWPVVWRKSTGRTSFSRSILRLDTMRRLGSMVCVLCDLLLWVCSMPTILAGFRVCRRGCVCLQ